MIDITVVLDKSGSMNSIKESTIKGYNGFLDEQKNLGTQGNITLVQFNSEDYTKSPTQPINDAFRLSDENYKPDGMTPLLDALGRTIKETGDKLRDMTDRPDKVMFVIITDGQENWSKEYNQNQIYDMIEHQRTKYSWEFVYLGANQDSFMEAGYLGIPLTMTMNFASAECMYKNVSTMVHRYSNTGDASFTNEERILQKIADKNWQQ